jgi:hypothetical protein
MALSPRSSDIEENLMKYLVVSLFLLFSSYSFSQQQNKCVTSELAGDYEGEGETKLFLENEEPWKTPCQLSLQITSDGPGNLQIPKCKCLTKWGAGVNCYVGQLKIQGNEVLIWNRIEKKLDLVGRCSGSSLKMSLNNQGKYPGTVNSIGDFKLQAIGNYLQFESSTYGLPNLEILTGEMRRKNP